MKQRRCLVASGLQRRRLPRSKEHPFPGVQRLRLVIERNLRRSGKLVQNAVCRRQRARLARRKTELQCSEVERCLHHTLQLGRGDDGPRDGRGSWRGLRSRGPGEDPRDEEHDARSGESHDDLPDAAGWSEAWPAPLASSTIRRGARRPRAASTEQGHGAGRAAALDMGGPATCMQSSPGLENPVLAIACSFVSERLQPRAIKAARLTHIGHSYPLPHVSRDLATRGILWRLESATPEGATAARSLFDKIRVLNVVPRTSACLGATAVDRSASGVKEYWQMT